MENNTKTLSLIAIVLLLACGISGYLLYGRFWSGYNDAQANKALSQQRNQQLKRTLNSVHTFVSNFDKQKVNAKLSNLALPANDSDMANFINNLSQLAEASGMTLANMQITQPPVDTRNALDYKINVQMITLALSGTYPGFQDFMKRVETNLRLIDIYHLIVGGQDDSEILQYQIQLRTYYQK